MSTPKSTNMRLRLLLCLLAFFAITVTSAAKGNYQEVSASGKFFMVLKTDETLWAWGGNKDGQLGDGTTTDRYTPVKIADRVKTVSCGWNISIYITEEGDLMITGKMNKK